MAHRSKKLEMIKRKRVATILLLVSCIESKRSVKRSKWVSDYLGERQQQEMYRNLTQGFATEGPGHYRRFTRMTEASFHQLLNMVRPYITKKDTYMRQAISAEERLAVTLRYLATGETYHSLHCQFRISVQAISQLVPEVCEAIYIVLKVKYMPTPKSAREWEDVANLFNDAWNFPHCIGAIDGKHVRVLPPARSGSRFYKHKGLNSFAFIAVVDAKYRFIYVDVGTNGLIKDGGVWNKTTLYQQLEDAANPLNIPAEKEIVGCVGKIPYVLVGDEAFALKSYLQKPYPGSALTEEKRIFNYRLSRARRVSENAIGHMVKMWGLYKTAIDLDLEVAKIACLATCTLHNFLIAETSVYLTEECLDCEDREAPENSRDGSWRSEPGGDAVVDLATNSANHSKRFARGVRDVLCAYFSGAGEIPTQQHCTKD